MGAPQFYNQRLKQDFIREVSLAIQNKVNDPRIPDMVTIPAMKLSPDTRNATIFVSLYGLSESKRKGALIALNNAAPFIQKTVASRIKIKNFPKIYFKLDNAFEETEHINTLLEQIKDDLE